jgi:hypothetical protein
LSQELGRDIRTAAEQKTIHFAEIDRDRKSVV